MATATHPQTLAELRASGWQSLTVKEELRRGMIRALEAGESLFPGIVGYDDTVIPEVVLAILAGHDMLFLGEKGQAKSRIMRMLVRFLEPEIPYLDIPGCPVHEDPYRPITQTARMFLQQREESEVPIKWWNRDERYTERLAPGTKFADVIGEIDPAKLVAGVTMGAEDALHFGLIPRMHRGIFAMNELPELDELVQVGLFNILEERDVQIRGYPIRFEVDVCVLFSANPATYNRSGKVIPQLKDRIGSLIRTHYPRDRELAIEITQHETNDVQADDYPVEVPRFMCELIEQITLEARRSKYVDQQSGVSVRFSLANYRTMIASAQRRAILHGESPAVPRMSDLAHLESSGLGKLELDLMGSQQMSEQQVLEHIVATAIESVFGEYVEQHGLAEIAEIFSKGVRIEVGDMLPSAAYAERLTRVPPVWEKAFEVNAAQSEAVRASCVEFVLAGLYAMDKISRHQQHGRISYQLGSEGEA